MFDVEKKICRCGPTEPLANQQWQPNGSAALSRTENRDVRAADYFLVNNACRQCNPYDRRIWNSRYHSSSHSGYIFRLPPRDSLSHTSSTPKSYDWKSTFESFLNHSVAIIHFNSEILDSPQTSSLSAPKQPPSVG